MWLFEEMMEDCTRLVQRSVSDGLGGQKLEWEDGDSFKAAIVKNNSVQAKVAEKQGVTDMYQVTVPKGTHLSFHDVFRRNSDGLVLRATSNVKDSETPPMATFSFGQVSAERWELR